MALALILGGCHAVYPYGARSVDRGADGARPGDLGQTDGAADRALPDAAPPDAASPDGVTTTSSRCGLAIDEHTVALYTFDDDSSGVLLDELGAHHGEILEPSSAVTHEAVDGCSSALFTQATTAVRAALIPHAAAWDLAEGSVELRVRFDDAPGAPNAVLSRDAYGQVMSGHLMIQRSAEGVLVARQQHADGTTGHRCSVQTLEGGRWFDVVVSFGSGGLTLSVDGVPGTRGGMVDLWGSGSPSIWCNDAAIARGIAGNANPWVIGLATNAADEGSYPPSAVGFPLRGAVDYLRISSAPAAP